MIRIVLVEDQAMLRDSLACTINAQQDMEVVASLANAADALEATRRTGATCTRVASWRRVSSRRSCLTFGWW